MLLDMVPRNDSRETKTDTLSFTIFDTLFFVIIPDKSFSGRSVVENDEICILLERNPQQKCGPQPSKSTIPPSGNMTTPFLTCFPPFASITSSSSSP